jgi:hypothetical protein
MIKIYNFLKICFWRIVKHKCRIGKYIKCIKCNRNICFLLSIPHYKKIDRIASYKYMIQTKQNDIV